VRHQTVLGRNVQLHLFEAVGVCKLLLCTSTAAVQDNADVVVLYAGLSEQEPHFITACCSWEPAQPLEQDVKEQYGMYHL
jgi:hypothetical protein